MSARECLYAKIRDAGLDRRRATEAVEIFDRLRADYERTGPSSADMRAAEDTLHILERRIRDKKRATLLQVRAQRRIRALADAHPNDTYQAMLAVLDFDASGRIPVPENVHKLTEAETGRAHAIMVSFLDRHRSKMAGLTRDVAGLRDVVRELFGEASGNPTAREVAKGLAEGMEYLRRRFNDAGGAIPKRKDWGLPQTHDRLRVGRAGRDQWMDFILPRLDPARMIDLETGLPMTELRLRQVLAEVHETIVSDGLNELDGAGFVGRSMMRRRQESRFLVFKDAAAWLEYQRDFGESDAFNTVVAHVALMARDIAQMHVLGPNPGATARYMESLVQRSHGMRAAAASGKEAERLIRQAQGQPLAIRAVYNEQAGHALQPGSARWADIGATARNLMVASRLGGAFITSITDVATQGVAAGMNGLSAARVVARAVKLFNPLDAADRRQAIRLGFTAQGWAARAIGAQRYTGEMAGRAWSQRLADTTMRLSLLSPWTEAGRWAFQTEYLGFITRHVEKRFEELPPLLRDAFKRNGLTPSDWQAIRETPLWTDPETGSTFLRAQSILERTDLHREAAYTLANKLQGVPMTEVEFAVISPTPRVRGQMVQFLPPGTFWGELARSEVQFHTFSVTLAHLYLRRLAGLPPLTRIKTAARLFIGLTVMGALAVQAKQIAAGRDPIDMSPGDDGGRRFWLAALTQGGGLGIYGDFLFARTNRFGMGMAETLGGPLIGTGWKAAQIADIPGRAEGDEKPPIAPQLFRFATDLLPGRSLWYTKLAFERLVLDELEKAIDPDYARRFRRIERQRLKDYGQRYFAPIGQGFPPERGPDMAQAFGG